MSYSKCKGKKDGVSGCRKCCKKHFNQSGFDTPCVKKCMRSSEFGSKYSNLIKTVTKELKKIKNGPQEKMYWEYRALADDIDEKEISLLVVAEYYMRNEFQLKALEKMNEWWERNYGSQAYQGLVVDSILRGRRFGKIASFEDYRTSPPFGKEHLTPVGPIRFKNEITGKTFNSLSAAYLDAIKARSVNVKDLENLQSWLVNYERDIGNYLQLKQTNTTIAKDKAKQIRTELNGYKKKIAKNTKIQLTTNPLPEIFGGKTIQQILLTVPINEIYKQRNKYRTLSKKNEKNSIERAKQIFSQLKSFRPLSETVSTQAPKGKTTPPVLNHFIDDIILDIKLPGWPHLGEQMYEFMNTFELKDKLKYFYNPESFVQDFQTELYNYDESDIDLEEEEE